MDEEQLVPGRPWQPALEEIIQNARTAAVLFGADGLGPWEQPEMRACLNQFVKRQLAVIPVILPNAPRQLELPAFLAEFTWVDFRAAPANGPLDPAALDRLEWGITGVRPGDVKPGAPVSAGDANQPGVAAPAPTAYYSDSEVIVNFANYRTVELARFSSIDTELLQYCEDLENALDA
jgi:hypothetical protein